MTSTSAGHGPTRPLRAFPWLPRRGSALGRAVVRAAGIAERLDPSALALRRCLRSADARPAPGLVVTCVYRRRNTQRVEALVRGSGSGVRWVLWALDEVSPSLAGMTVGTGPGARLGLHERMLASAAPEERAYWAILDDDVSLPEGALPLLVATARAGGLDISAPSHSYQSFWSHRFTIKRPLSLVRLTHFVEIGPVVVVSPRARRELLPLPSRSVAGWGVESYWSSLRRPQLRCGLVDAVTVRHLSPMGGDYVASAEHAEGVDFARTLGVEDFAADQAAMMTTLATWRPGRSTPPWAPRDPPEEHG